MAICLGIISYDIYYFRPCSIDAALFASLTILLKAPLLSCKLQNHLKTKVNLCQYAERILADCFKKPKVPGTFIFFIHSSYRKERSQSVENFKMFVEKSFAFFGFPQLGIIHIFQNMLQRLIGRLDPTALYFMNSAVTNE